MFALSKHPITDTMHANLPALAHKAHGFFMDAHQKGVSMDSALNSTGGHFPHLIQNCLDQMSARERHTFMSVALDSVDNYTQAHGQSPRPDMIANALVSALNTAQAFAQNGVAMDSGEVASSISHAQMGLTVGAVITGVFSAAIEDAVPFVSFIPAARQTVESKVLNFTAKSNFGGYALDTEITGTSAGKPYMQAARTYNLPMSADRTSFAFTATARVNQADVTTASGTLGLSILPGRTEITVNGLVVAIDTFADGDVKPVNTTLNKVLGAEYPFATGSINTKTGVMTFSFASALAVDDVVAVHVHVDFDVAETALPEFGFSMSTGARFSASESRGVLVTANNSIRQIQAETGMHAGVEFIMHMNRQSNRERLNYVMRRLIALGTGKGRIQEVLIDWENQGLQKSRLQVFADTLAPALNHAATRIMKNSDGLLRLAQILIPESLAAYMGGMIANPAFASGLNIYRLGDLNANNGGMVAVYVVPDDMLPPSGDGEDVSIVCVGGSNDPSNLSVTPIAWGDFIAPTFDPTVNTDKESRIPFYAHGFNQLNRNPKITAGVVGLRLKGVNISVLV